MISMVVCSTNGTKVDALSKNFDQLLRDHSHELIVIQDPRSLAEGYNRGIRQSHGEIIIKQKDGHAGIHHGAANGYEEIPRQHFDREWKKLQKKIAGLSAVVK